MNKKEYFFLCKKLDQILLHKESNTYTHAISLLHLTKEHPVFLKKYEFLFSENKLKIIIKLINIFFINLIKVTSFLFISLFKNNFKLKDLTFLKKKIDIIYI